MDRCRSAKRSAAWSRAVTETVRLVTEMPLWRLQRLRNESLDFLYAESPVTGHIRLKRGVPANLRRFHGMIVRLAQSEWMHFIQALPGNSLLLGPTSDLGQFLFGADRSALLRMTRPLAEVQGESASTASDRCKAGRLITSYRGHATRATLPTTWYWRIRNATGTRVISWPPRCIWTDG